MPVVVGNTLGTVTPLSQNINWNRGEAMPAISSLLLKSTNAEVVEVSVQFVGTSVQWITVNGNSENYFFIDDFLSSETLVLTAQNLDQLPNNNYKAVFQVIFSKSDGADKLVTSEVNLTLSGSYGAQTDKSIYNVIFNRINNTLTGDTTININNNPEAKLLKFWQPSDVFQPKSDFTDGFLLEDNILQSIATNPNIPLSGTFTHLCKILGPGDAYQCNFEIDMVVFNDSGIVVKQELFEFEVIKNQSEKSANLSILNPLGLDFEIEAPDWLSLSLYSGDDSADISVSTTTADLQAGIYNGFVKVIYDSGESSIPITLNLKEFIKIEESQFCLDFTPIKFTRINENGAYVKIFASALYTVMGVETLFEQSFIVPYINDQGVFDIGAKLHSYFPRYKKDLFDVQTSVEFMKPIDCSLIISELDVDYKELLVNDVINVKLMPGKEPKLYPIFSNYGFRNVKGNSEIYVAHYEVDSVLVGKIHPENGKIELGENLIQLYTFPKSYQPIHIQWENSNLVPEWFTFAGGYTINSEFTHTASKNVLNSLIEKFETTKIKKLSLNTGFMLRHELDLLEEMIMNKTVFIKIEGKIYECYNSTAKLQLQTSTDNVIDRDLEFIIIEKNGN